MKYIVVQHRTSTGFTVMQRQQNGEVEVYTHVCDADTAVQAGMIADALNKDGER
jgi:hypothetical protein